MYSCVFLLTKADDLLRLLGLRGCALCNTIWELWSVLLSGLSACRLREGRF